MSSPARRLSQQKRETGSLAPRSTARIDNQCTYDDKDEATIRELIKTKPDATLAEVAAALGKRPLPRFRAGPAACDFQCIADRAKHFAKVVDIRHFRFIISPEQGHETNQK